VGLATLSLFSVYMSKVKMAFFGGLAFSSLPELFELALIVGKRPNLKKATFVWDISDVNRLSSVSALVDYPENCLMVRLYQKHQANDMEIDTRQLLH